MIKSSSARSQRSRERQCWRGPQITPCPASCPRSIQEPSAHQAHFHKPRGPAKNKGRWGQPNLRMSDEDEPPHPERPWADPEDPQPQGPEVTPVRRGQCWSISGTGAPLPRGRGHVRGGKGSAFGDCTGLITRLSGEESASGMLPRSAA